MASTLITFEARNLDRVQKYLNRIEKNSDGNIKTDSFNVAEMISGELRKSKRNAGISDFGITGTLDSMLAQKPKNVGEKSWTVEMPAYALLLDKMETHSVGVDSTSRHVGSGGGESIGKWMQLRGIPNKQIRVRAHPFINIALLRVAQRLRGKLENGKFMRSIRKG